MKSFLTVPKLAGAMMVTLSLFLSACLGQEDKTSGKPVVMKTISNFKEPDSVVFDAKRNQFYVSQANFKQPYGGGIISTVSPEGEITNLTWITGLNVPKGMALYQDKLYVADSNNLIEIDIAAGKVAKKYYVAGSLLLNDVTVADDGTVYVSDTLTNQILRLMPGKAIEAWISDEKLDGPNGIEADGDVLYVASWGEIKEKNMKGLLAAQPLGKLIKINIKDKSIRPLSKEPVGNLDGLEFDGKGNAYISDWKTGTLHLIKLDGTILKSFDMAKILGVESARGLADIVHVKDKEQIWVTMMGNGTMQMLSIGKKQEAK